jgi:aspartate 1-decarboxylase
MTRTFLKSKIHRATVTEADLNYEGSLTLDPELMERADILEFEKVSVVNINNGARFETYVIAGEKGSGTVCLNGAAARLGEAGDKVIIISYADMTKEEYDLYEPKVVLLGADNRVKEYAPLHI